MRTLYCGRTRATPEVEADLGVTHVELDELLAESDFVSLHTTLEEGTRHLIDARAIARMKEGAVLIDTSRGGVVDQAALPDPV